MRDTLAIVLQGIPEAAELHRATPWLEVMLATPTHPPENPYMDNGKQITRTLPVDLDDETRIAKGRELAERTRAREAAIDARTMANKGHNLKIKEIDAEITKLADQVDSGVEQAEVAVEWRNDYARKVKELYRLDQEEVVQTEPLSNDELQTDIPGSYAEGEQKWPPEQAEGSGPGDLVDDATAEVEAEAGD